MSRIFGPYAASTIAERRVFGRRFMQIEEERANLCHYNRLLSDVTWWTRDNLAAAPDQVGQIISPDANVYGWEVQENTSNTSHGLQGDVTVDGSSTYCISVWAYTDSDANRSNYLGLSLGDMGGGLSTFTTWDLTSGTLISAGLDIDNSGIEDWGGGWYRVWITAASGAAVTTTCQVHLTNAAGDETYTGTSKTAVWFHPQIEVGDFPSSPIISTSSDVTRNADVFYWPSASVPSGLRGKITFNFYPYWDSDKKTNDSTFAFFVASGVSAQYAYNFNATSDKFELRTTGGSLVFASDAVSFSALDEITLTYDPVNGQLIVAGCDSGNGTYTGTPWNTSAGNVQWGYGVGASSRVNGLISEPY